MKITDLRDKLPTNPDGVKFKRRDVSKVQGAVFHQALSWGTIEDIAAYHTGPNHMSNTGLERISYTFGVRRNGEVCQLNDLDLKVWSQGFRERPGDENAEFFSVLFEGLFTWRDSEGIHHQYMTAPAGEPTTEQIKSAIDIWNHLADEYGFGIKDLYGHYHFGKPSCPGISLSSLVECIRNQYNFKNELDIKRFLKVFGFANVKDFQKKVGLDDDGIVGPMTRRAMYKYVQTGSAE